MTRVSGKAVFASCLAVALICGCESSAEQVDAGTQEDAAITCDQSLTNPNGTTCDWEWTCSDYSGVIPELSMQCEVVAADEFSCECRQAGALTATISVLDACLSITNGCEAANAACGFSRTIVCPQ